MALIHQVRCFSLHASDAPHVSREDGGHAVIYPDSPVVHRWEFDPEQATALMRFSMLAGQAMFRAMNERGVAVERINFQDNGNWAIDTPQGPRFHLHLYGRARGSIHQAHGEALYFPPKATRFWESLEPLNAEDRRGIAAWIKRLASEPKYDPERWGMPR